VDPGRCLLLKEHAGSVFCIVIGGAGKVIVNVVKLLSGSLFLRRAIRLKSAQEAMGMGHGTLS
jgi:hypothetical protein